MFTRHKRYFIHVEIAVFVCFVINSLATRISQHPVDVTVREGDKVELSCKIRRLRENQEVWWYKNTSELSHGRVILQDPVDSRYTVTSFPDGLTSIYVLQIYPTTRSDNGVYTCKIVSDADIVLESENASVIILEVPRQRYPECRAEQDTFIVNDLVSLNCSTEIIQPTVSLSWSLDNTIVDSEIYITDKIKTIQYKFRAMKTDNRKSFLCVLKSDMLMYSRNCSIGPVNMLYKPTVKIHSTSNTVIAGREVFIACNSDANPLVREYKWKISPDMPHKYVHIDKESTQVLRIVNISTDQNNTIVSCTAENEVGSGFDQVKLFVEGKEQVKESHPENLPENVSSVGISLPLPILIACAITSIVLILITVIVPLYFLCICKKGRKTEAELNVPINITEMQEILQPDYYFEPRDRVLPRVPDNDRQFTWKKHIGVQVPDDNYDIASTFYMYLTLNEPKRSRHIEHYRHYHTLNPMRF
ncbi:cell adhesion molecule 3-like [Antedon mediterranea]|uniref:cell adhesion molecule 3-like n=1 Tax=Antedon mediterranea TaxID=105859 RepID=UPI003AF88664